MFAGVLTSIIKGYGYYFVYKVAKEKYLKPWDIHEHNISTRTSYFSNSTYMFFASNPDTTFPYTYMTNHLLMVILILPRYTLIANIYFFAEPIVHAKWL